MIVVDSQIGEAARAAAAVPGLTIGNPPTIFPSIEAAMASFAKLNNPPRIGLDRERAHNALIKVENGYMLKRDPDNGNTRPIGEGAQMPRRPNRDVWQELAGFKPPTCSCAGSSSDRMTDPKIIARVSGEFPKLTMVTVDCRHDIANEAPDALLAHVRKFVGSA